MKPILILRLTLASGETVERGYTEADADEIPQAPPSWLLNPRRSWDEPQDAILMQGDVPAGMEGTARMLVDPSWPL